MAEPYKQVKQKTRQLANLHSTVELMRGVIRVLKLVCPGPLTLPQLQLPSLNPKPLMGKIYLCFQIRRLRDHLSQGLENAELAKAAQLYADISEVLRADADLAGVELVGQELSWHSQVGQEISTEAFRGLQQGLASMNQAEIGGALQVKTTVSHRASLSLTCVTSCTSGVLQHGGAETHSGPNSE